MPKKAKPKDTGARADVLALITQMRDYIRRNDTGTGTVWSAWHNAARSDDAARLRLLAFVYPDYGSSLTVVGYGLTHAESLRWLDTVIAHDTAELKARGVL